MPDIVWYFILYICLLNIAYSLHCVWSLWDLTSFEYFRFDSKVFAQAHFDWVFFRCISWYFVWYFYLCSVPSPMQSGAAEQTNPFHTYPPPATLLLCPPPHCCQPQRPLPPPTATPAFFVFVNFLAFVPKSKSRNKSRESASHCFGSANDQLLLLLSSLLLLRCTGAVSRQKGGWGLCNCCLRMFVTWRYKEIFARQQQRSAKIKSNRTLGCHERKRGERERGQNGTELKGGEGSRR